MNLIDNVQAALNLVGGSISSLGDVLTYHDGQTPPTEEEINAEKVRMQAEYNAQEYARNRASATGYPSIPEQLDEIYHNGIDSWKAVIKVTKDKYPKG